MNKSYKALMTDDTQQRIRLATNNGLTGYKITKFEIFPFDDSTVEATFKIYSKDQSTSAGGVGNTNTTDFGDPTLLAAAYFTMDGSSQIYPENLVVVVDNKIVNQDIYITMRCHNSAADLNYYIELEQMKLSKDEATVATLKDMRAGPDTNFGP
jgi:hypothetical protein